MEKGDLYKDLAYYYDLIYDWKDYKTDVARVESIVASHCTTGGTSLLDIGCGTGGHLLYLQKSYSCVGIDKSLEMLEVAREKLPDIDLIEADMMDFDLGRTFDVVVSLFSTIGYATTPGDLEAVTGNIAKHLKEGGVAIVEPWLRKSDIRPRYVGMHTYDSEAIKIARLGRLIVEDDISVFEAHYLIAEDGDIRHVVDRHRLAMLGEDAIVAALSKAGLDAWFEDDAFVQDRGAVIAVKRSR